MHTLDTEFEDLATTGVSFYPKDPRGGIEDALDALYEPVNYGVYRIGFARTQAASRGGATCAATASPTPSGPSSRRSCVSTPLPGYSKCNLGCIVDYPNL